MRPVKVAGMCILLVCGLGAQQPAAGIRPRTKVTDYAVHHQAKDFTLGAARLSSVEVANAFVTELNKGYVVVEVGLYPAPSTALTVVREDFALRVAGTKTVLRPASPETIAAILQKRPSAERDVTLYPTGAVVFGNGGTGTSVGLGVGIGNKPTNGTTEADRKTMETELRDKGLPPGKTEKPVAGYLYFPRSTNERASYELEYGTGEGAITLPLPAARTPAPARRGHK